MKLGSVGSGGNTDQILEMAGEAERSGWDGFFTWDGISIGEMDAFDPWTMLGAIAVRTTTIRLGAMIFPLARRRPWKVARESITVAWTRHSTFWSARGPASRSATPAPTTPSRTSSSDPRPCSSRG